MAEKPAPKDSSYIPTLDGWRAVAIVAVIISHAQERFDPGVKHVLSYGRHGVDLFFAISGFLICSRMLREWDARNRISVRGFFIRRSFRILPLYFAFCIALAAFHTWGGLPASSEEIWACVFFYRNYAIPPQGGYTAHFWSLAVEEHFYLLWPVIFLMLKPRRAFWATAIIAIAVQVWRAADTRWSLFAQVLPDAGWLQRTDTRFDAILWGCFAAMICWKHPKLTIPGWVSWASVAAIVAALWIEVPVLNFWLAILFPLLIVATVRSGGSAMAWILECRPLRWIGALSYSLYVWQAFFLQKAWHNVPDPAWLTWAKQWPIWLLLLILVAMFSHHWFERPMIRLGRRFEKWLLPRHGEVPTTPKPAAA